MNNVTGKNKQKNEHVNFAMMITAIKVLVALFILYGINGSLSYTINKITQFIVTPVDISFYTWWIIVSKIFLMSVTILLLCCFAVSIMIVLLSLFRSGLYTKLFNYVNLKFTSKEEDFLLCDFYKYSHLHQYSEIFKEFVYNGCISDESLTVLLNDNELCRILKTNEQNKLWRKFQLNQQMPKISKSNKVLLIWLSKLSELVDFRDLILAIYNGRDKVDKLVLKQLLQSGGGYLKKEV